MPIASTSSSHADSVSLRSLDLNSPQDPPQQLDRQSTPPIATTQHDQVSIRRGSQELALRSQLVTPEQTSISETGSVVLAPAADAARQAQLTSLRHFAQEQAAPFKNGENDHALDALAEQRAQRLLERGENADDLKTLFSFADAVDASAHDAAGASGSIGFLLANVFGGHVTPLLVDGAAHQGAVSGVVTYALLHTVGNINEKMTAHSAWGKPSLDDLDPEVAAVVERNAAGTMQKFKELGINYQAFPATFMLTGLLNSALTFASLKTAMMAKNAIGPLSSLVGGGIVAQLGRNADLRHHRVGSALILMSDNWEEHLDTLKNTTYMKSMRNGGKQLSTATRQKFLAGLQQAAAQAVLPSTLTKAAIWTGGMALNSWASAQVTQLMKSHGFNDAEIFTAQSAMFAIALVPTTAAWTSLIALGPQLDQKAKQALDAVISLIPRRPAPQQQAAQPQLPAA